MYNIVTKGGVLVASHFLILRVDRRELNNVLFVKPCSRKIFVRRVFFNFVKCATYFTQGLVNISDGKIFWLWNGSFCWPKRKKVPSCLEVQDFKISYRQRVQRSASTSLSSIGSFGSFSLLASSFLSLLVAYRPLLSSSNAFQWWAHHEGAFVLVEKTQSSPPILAFFERICLFQMLHCFMVFVSGLGYAMLQNHGTLVADPKMEIGPIRYSVLGWRIIAVFTVCHMALKVDFV